MRVMVLVKATEQSEAGEMPSEELLTRDEAFNEELVKAGVMLAGEGLHPSSKGARVAFSGSERKVIDGPFAETKELLAGFWLWQVKSLDEAIEWVKRIPNPDDGADGDGRDPPGVRGRGLRRGAHARAARAGGARCARRPRRAGSRRRGDDRRHERTASRPSGGSSRARLIAGLARIVRDVGLAEDLAQEALVAALEQWPESGVPDNPGAWLMATAKHRAIDRLRRAEVHERKTRGARRASSSCAARRDAPDLAAAIDDPFGDDLLRLIFTACHPVLSTEARVALTLRLLGGLTTEEIARAFLVPEATVAQRIVRAKRTLVGGARAVRGARARRAAPSASPRCSR